MKVFQAIVLPALLLIGCATSSRIKPKVEEAPPRATTPDQTEQVKVHQSRLIQEALKEAELDYMKGVIYYQQNVLDSSQISFEKALEILSDLDFDADEFPSEAKWMETLLREIEADYQLALMASGKFFAEGSASAFRELFSDIKNFKKLREQHHLPATPAIAPEVTYDVPVYLNEKVENSIVYLQTVAHDLFEKFLGRSTRYIPIMEKILAEEGLPHDLVYLPLIESGFNPHAYSYAKAMGPWQFIASTGKRYGLQRNWWYDERRDFEKSTRAACRYLRDLYTEFGSWELALAAYNGGEGRVRKEISRLKTNDFWKLRLKKQTRDYVPLFMAAVLIAKEPQKYGFNPVYEPPLEWETVQVNKCISLSNIASKLALSVEELELLNPEILRGVTPPNYTNYQLRLPPGYKEAFLAAYEEIPSEKVVSWVNHRVRKGETLSRIASRYGVPMSAIVAANKLDAKHRIYVGQNLLIPREGLASSSEKPGRPATKPTTNVEAAAIDYDEPVVHVVKKGESLGTIASAYGVTVAALKNVNRLRSNTIHPGMRLRIPGNGKEMVIEVTGINHRVKNGETLGKIAARYAVTVAAIKETNRLKSDIIRPGMVLKIPARKALAASPQKSQNAPTTYQVKRGDTLWSIARLFEVSVEELMEWNGLPHPKALRSGETIKIYAR